MYKKVNCWFCSHNSYIDKGYSSFYCAYCDQYNGFNKEGDYDRPIVAMYDEPVSNINYYVTRRQIPKKNTLCTDCLRQEEYKLELIRHCDDTQSEEKYDNENILKYIQQLETRYPLCGLCMLKVKEEVERVERRLKCARLQYSLVQSVNLHSDTTKSNIKARMKVTAQGLWLILLLMLLLDVLDTHSVNNRFFVSIVTSLSLLWSIYRCIRKFHYAKMSLLVAIIGIGTFILSTGIREFPRELWKVEYVSVILIQSLIVETVHMVYLFKRLPCRTMRSTISKATNRRIDTHRPLTKRDESVMSTDQRIQRLSISNEEKENIQNNENLFTRIIKHNPSTTTSSYSDLPSLASLQPAKWGPALWTSSLVGKIYEPFTRMQKNGFSQGSNQWTSFRDIHQEEERKKVLDRNILQPAKLNLDHAKSIDVAHKHEITLRESSINGLSLKNQLGIENMISTVKLDKTNSPFEKIMNWIKSK